MKKIVPGILLSSLLAFVAWFLGKQFPLAGAPIFAIILGMLLNPLFKFKGIFKAGLGFASKKILQAAVVLLGFGLNLSVIAKTGLSSLPIILGTIGMALLTAYLFYRLIPMDQDNAILIGVGSSICGGSAIAATAPVIGASDEAVAQSISVIFFFNVLAALIFPSLGQVLGMSNEGFGLFAGTAVNDTSSVTAAAAAWDAIHQSDTLSIATVVKLTRTLAILPITMGLSLLQKKGSKAKVSLPSFILYFLLASLVTTIATSLGFDPQFFKPLQTLSKFFIVVAMAAIGLGTDLFKLLKSGGKPLLLGFLCWMAVSLTSLFLQMLLHLR